MIADDTVDAEKTIPRALFAGTLTATFVYMLSLAGVMALLPQDQLAASAHPFADAAKIMFGSAGGWFVGIGALIAIGGALNACVFLTGVVPQAGVKEGLFPAVLGQTSGSGAASNAILLSSGLASLLILTNASQGLLKSFELMILISTFSVLIAYLGAALASVKLQLQDRESGAHFRVTGFIVSLIAAAFSCFALWGAWALYQ
ncbi:MAG: amino acid permease [Pseudomonadota bacterium]